MTRGEFTQPNVQVLFDENSEEDVSQDVSQDGYSEDGKKSTHFTEYSLSSVVVPRNTGRSAHLLHVHVYNTVLCILLW